MLTDRENRIDRSVLKSLSEQLSELKDAGIEVLLVSSGAIGAGLGMLKLAKKPRSLSELQAIAAIGQNHLMDIYNEYFTPRGYLTGQILLTQEDFSDRKRYLNIKYTLDTLIRYGAVPIINENDSVSTAEIKCGDNDRISSLVADLSGSDMLVILSDVEGLYDADGTVIRQVDSVDDSILSLCRGKGCEVSTGGMTSKLRSVKHAMRSGVACVIAKGRRPNVLKEIMNGEEVGTRFSPAKRTITARKRWIAYGLKPKGHILVDDGAAKALVSGNKSLLPSGIAGTEGVFESGDVVEIVSKGRKTIARGLSNYSSQEIDRIKGKRTDRIEAELGYKDYDEVIHKDNLVVTE